MSEFKPDEKAAEKYSLLGRGILHWQRLFDAHISGQKVGYEMAQAEAVALKDKPSSIDKPIYYWMDKNGTKYTKNDPEVTCTKCSKTFRTDPFDASCRLCGERF